MNDESQEAYWQSVEAFVELANDHLEGGQDLGLTCSAFLEAASRFSAFYAATSSEDRKAFKEDEDDIVKNIAEKFRESLEKNIEDYIENYKVFIANSQNKKG